MRITTEAYHEERLRGARIMVWFRWIFIALLGTLVSIQFFSGYRTESLHALRLIGVYLLTNVFFSLAVYRRYDPPWVGYAGATADIGVLLYHLHFQSLYFDPVAISAASTVLLIPFLYLLYTLRLDRKLLVYVILLGLAGLGGIYAYHYSMHPEIYRQSLSLSPYAQGFKMTYILFLGILCLYHQFSIFRFIRKLVDNLQYQADLNMQIKLEKQKSAHAKELEVINAGLEEAVEQRTRELTEVNTQVIRLQKENLQSQFEVLKQQVNPHFLFNSLNVLSSLIRIDPVLAEKFTGQLSKVYRYVLENKEKELVSLETELDFLRAYSFLIDIRFRDKVIIKNLISGTETEGLIVPLALQLLIENAIKHNTFSRKKPLVVELSIDNDGWLLVANNLQSRENRMASTGIGLANIGKRYELLSAEQPVFEKTGDRFLARIPLLRETKQPESNQENKEA